MIGVITNPNSRRNRRYPGQKKRLLAAVRGQGEVIATQSVDEIAPAVMGLLDRGYRYLVADGGDGALHWMINSLADTLGPEQAAEAAIFVPTAGGTVDFVAKAIGLKGAGAQVVRSLARRVAAGKPVPTRPVQSAILEGKQRLEDGSEVNFRRIGFGNALAGYGANFFIPFYAGDAGRGALRIIATCGAMFGAATTRYLVPDSLKPERLKDAEEVFLRPAHAEVEVDGEQLRNQDGSPMLIHNALQCASIPLNLSGVFRVFPLAGAGRMHIHAGRVTPAEMFRIMPHLATGRTVSHIVPTAYDDSGSSMNIRCLNGTALDPVIDGELYWGITELKVTMGPRFMMAVP